MAAAWRCVDEIVAYQRAVTLRDTVLELLDSDVIPFNYNLRDQIAAAARSVPANISEGFDRYRHGQFGYHAGVAKGSLGELATHLGEIRKRQFISKARFDDLMRLVEGTRRPLSGLLRHLTTTEAPAPWSEKMVTNTNRPGPDEK